MNLSNNYSIKYKYIAYSVILGLLLVLMLLILSYVFKLIEFSLIRSIVIAVIGVLCLYAYLYKKFKTRLKNHIYIFNKDNWECTMPSDFHVKHVHLSKLIKRYRFGVYFFPEKFISFIEGNRIYMRKNIKDSKSQSLYKIISFYDYHYVLVQDDFSNIWIAHLGQLEVKMPR